MSSTTCIHCGAPLNRPGAKFCTSCGKPQPAAQPVAVQTPVVAPATPVPAPPTALRYQGLDLNLAVKNGIIQTDPMFLNLRGVRLLATEPIEVSGDIRVHWKRDGWTLPDYKFSDFVSSMQRFVSAAPAE